jgi:hypothetical protein
VKQDDELPAAFENFECGSQRPGQP